MQRATLLEFVLTSLLMALLILRWLSGGQGKEDLLAQFMGWKPTTHLPKFTFNAKMVLASTSSAGGTATNYTDSAGNGSTASADSAANPTRAIPGELVYTGHSVARQWQPWQFRTQDDYKAKTG